jgi:hypothetical protein
MAGGEAFASTVAFDFASIEDHRIVAQLHGIAINIVSHL